MKAVCLTGALLLAGCASPGPPRPPSLHLPRPVSDLAATRAGDAVLLRFTVPALTTDGQVLREPAVAGTLCRQADGHGPCTPLPAGPNDPTLPLPVAGHPAAPVTWTDTLPMALRTGAPRLLAYRVELRNGAGRSAGISDPVFAAGGSAPPPVQGLAAEGRRLGVALHWTPAPDAGEVLIERSPVSTGAPEKESPAPRPSSPGRFSREHDHPARSASSSLWLQAAPGDRSARATIDGDAREGTTYRYEAVRREAVQIGGHALELRSAISGPVTFTWRDVYAPPTPTGVSALGYHVPPESGLPAPAGPAAYAVDLVWQPVNDARLAGYLVYRQTLSAAGTPTGPRERLTPEPVTVPGFHDPQALPSARYRYGITAIDARGNESPAATAVVDPLVAE